MQRVLVANRGEIAARILRTARSLGISTVAVFAEADRDASYLGLADVTVSLGVGAASETYLSIPKIIAVAQQHQVDAVHPGYGFLSENADFAAAVTAAGMIFIGPAPEIIKAMGRKDIARDLAVQAGVPVLPSYQTDQEVVYPVLVKAAAGGGGKGMRVVTDPADLAAAKAAAAREALAAFGDDTLLLERYLPAGRHIEVQVAGDVFGNIVHLFERDCSVQRRHQKVIEEAPAPTISTQLRQQLTAAAVALAKQVSYTNLGTVEFLVSGEEFFFLEMNTRLQVEVPVTEKVTQTDLVRWQFLLASGQQLPLLQKQIQLTGHAIQARVYAEDPYQNFLPQAGTALEVIWPPRQLVDLHFGLGSPLQVGTDYDPMLAKLVSYAATRDHARQRLVRGIDQSAIVGLATNLGFLRRVLASEVFINAQIDTAWLDKQNFVLTTPPEIRAQAAVIRGSDFASKTAFGQTDSWRVTGSSPDSAVVFTAAQVVSTAAGVFVTEQGQTFFVPDPDAFVVQQVTPLGSLQAPMPGKVLSVAVQLDQQVVSGQTLAIIEAMKMELPIIAPKSGQITKILVEPGGNVSQGTDLFVITAPSQDAE